MLRAYRRCDEKRNARLEIIMYLIELSAEMKLKIAALYQPPKTAKKDEIDAPLAFKEDFARPETATA